MVEILELSNLSCYCLNKLTTNVGSIKSYHKCEFCRSEFKRVNNKCIEYWIYDIIFNNKKYILNSDIIETYISDQYNFNQVAQINEFLPIDLSNIKNSVNFNFEKLMKLKIFL
jgi:hypothetical protein